MPSHKPTVLCALTWEGGSGSNNYTSIDLYGLQQFAKAVLEMPRVRLVYKPHPRGLVEMQGGTPGMFDDVSLLITYIPSVCLDFLYLHPEEPIVLAGHRTDRQPVSYTHLTLPTILLV